LISQASVLFSNGLNLEGRLQEALERLKTRKAVYAVAEMIPHEKLREVSPGTGIFDPHIWFDVSLWALATTEIGQTLATLDPDRSADYLQRAALYTTRLEELHRWCTQSIASIPSDQRVLITAHDAFGYFGRAYNIHVLGIQGISTESEPSLSGINKLVDLVVTRHIPAVFVESSVSPRTVQALIEGARRRGAKLTPGKELFSDALGPPNSEQGTYLGMIRYNVSAITEALSGREAHDTH
jgi:manganese/zinc/iron transport system substrate-binding protein